MSITALSRLFVAFFAISVFLPPVHALDLFSVDCDGEQCPAVHSVMLNKTATGFWERHHEFGWTVGKSASPSSLELPAGSSGTVNYFIQVSSTLLPTHDVYGVKGTICAYNVGLSPSNAFNVTDAVKYSLGNSTYNPVPNATAVYAMPVLQPNQSACVVYRIEFAPIANALYRNTLLAGVTFQNNTFELMTRYFAAFSLPASPVLLEEQHGMRLEDVTVCPAGFTCTRSDNGPWMFYHGGINVSYTLNVTNINASCNSTFAVNNTAAIYQGAAPRGSDSVAVGVFTGPCPTQGCTYTIGYWKNHEEHLGQHLPQWLGTANGTKSVNVGNISFAVYVLNHNLGSPSNGVTKLYSQLLAGKLNIANGAGPAAVLPTIAVVDPFLAMYNWQNWTGMNATLRAMVNGWKNVMESFNNGTIGPGHCPDDALVLELPFVKTVLAE